MHVYSNADSIVNDELFVEPASKLASYAGRALADPQILSAVELSMKDFLAKLDPPQPLPPPAATSPDPVYYLQSQNGNLGGEYEVLLEDVGAEGPSFAREVFGGL
jgi:hypothetical protein